jgi:uncharacterized membrane protein
MSPTLRPTPRTVEDPVTRNVREIAQLENQRAESLTRREHIALEVSRLAGSLWFGIAQLTTLLSWILWNSRGPMRWRFDPFPFGIMTMVVSIESVLLASFVLMAQNRQGREAERRNHLALQISVLAEQEMTAVLRQVDAIARRVGAARVDEQEQMMADTELSEILRHIDEQMPGQS